MKKGFTFLFWFISICINLYSSTLLYRNLQETYIKKSVYFSFLLCTSIPERYHYNGVRSNRYNTYFYCLSWVVLWRQKSTINVKGLWNRFYLPNVKWFFLFSFFRISTFLRFSVVPSGRYWSINEGVVSLSDTSMKINDLTQSECFKNRTKPSHMVCKFAISDPVL